MEKRQLLLKAVHQNWGLMTGGSWRNTTWLINFDRSYKITDTFNLKPEDLEPDEFDFETLKRGKVVTTSGIIDVKTFNNLIDAMNKPWPDPEIRIRACDGSAWQISQFSKTGEKINSNGELGYIYGLETLEGIARILIGISKAAK